MAATETMPTGRAARRPATAEVGAARERQRRRRLRAVACWLAGPAAYLWYRLLTGAPVSLLALPSVDPLYLMSGLFFLALTAVLLGTSVVAGRSPHITYRPEQIDVGMDDVKGIDQVKEDALRSLDLFLGAGRFRREMGGTPRRGLLFEGAPGTGKTLLAKAMAGEAGVPFLFVSATAFQSMYYGATARKIRSYFRALRKAARQEGGAIGFIEEIDAIAVARGGLAAVPAPVTGNRCGGLSGLPAGYDERAATAHGGGRAQLHRSVVSEGVGGVVNELLVQMQSFDAPTGPQRVRGAVVDRLNLFLPPARQLPRPRPPQSNLLLIAATNRADNLDPALLRPGRFDRRLTFEAPAKSGRRELVDHFLARKAHAADLDGHERRDGLAAITQGYTPVMIEHLFDEALVNALRRGASAMTWADIEQARLVEEVGLGQPVDYTDHEQRLIATHEAGHAAMAWLVSPHRRLEILSIVKRRAALGLLAHGDREDVYTRSRAELIALVQIALGGQVAEELFFGDVSTGPGSDLLYATSIAAEMVGSAGMADTLVSYAAVRGSGLTDTNITGRVLADAQARAQVESLLQAQKAGVRERLAAEQHLVVALRDALLERHELIGSEITDVLESARARRPTRGASAEVMIDLREARAADDLR